MGGVGGDRRLPPRAGPISRAEGLPAPRLIRGQWVDFSPIPHNMILYHYPGWGEQNPRFYPHVVPILWAADIDVHMLLCRTDVGLFLHISHIICFYIPVHGIVEIQNPQSYPHAGRIYRTIIINSVCNIHRDATKHETQS